MEIFPQSSVIISAFHQKHTCSDLTMQSCGKIIEIIYETNECIKNKSGAAMKEKWTFFSQHKVFPDRWHLIKVTLSPHTHSEAVYRSRAAAIQQMSPCNPHCNTYMWKWNHLYCSHMKRRVKNQFSSDLCFSNSEVWTLDFCILFVLITVSGWFWSQRNL